MTPHRPSDERRKDERDDRDDDRSVRWLERAAPAIFFGLVVVIVLLWLLGRFLGAPWAR